jgi:D-alanyl-D-alanine dipeptidase
MTDESAARERLTAATCVIAAALAVSPLSATEMPDDFVYLRDVDPSIRQDIRYAGDDNFTGAPVPGYDAAECVLVRQAAEALKAVQSDLEPKGLALRVYDCYRPTQAVAAFVAWAKKPDDPAAKAVHYPNLSKTDLFPGYIATRSGHSRGATLDLTVEPIGGVEKHPRGINCTAPEKKFAPDGSLAMGTSFDCFDVKANTQAPGLTSKEMAHRALLRDAMGARGFKNYPLEWWHYTFEPEPYPDRYFDFPILPRPNGGNG